MATCDHRNWLHEFRRSIKTPKEAAEFVRVATSYNPHVSHRNTPLGRCTNRNNESGETKDESVKVTSDGKCTGVAIGTVADVYACGISAFVSSRDVQLDLAKIYLFLSTAKKRLSSSTENGSSRTISTSKSTVASETNDKEVHDEKAVLYTIVKRFERYVTMSMSLAEECPFNEIQKEQFNDVDMSIHSTYKNQVADSMANFRISPADYRTLVSDTEPEEKVTIAMGSERHVLMLSWEFYKYADCSDIFKLLCYSLSMGNFEAYRVIINNHYPCMLKHVQENWKVLLSYIPVVCKYGKCKDIIENIFRAGHEIKDESCRDALDWTLWRAFIILNTTGCSYYLLLKFLKSMLGLFESVETQDKELRSRLHLMFTFVSLVKQYVLYINHKVGMSVCLNELEETPHLPFRTYLQLKPADKLQLFIDCIDTQTVAAVVGEDDTYDCECDQLYKDKHGIYASCLHCKTTTGISRLATFIRLMKVAEDNNDWENQFCTLDQDFSVFFETVKECACASINDYMEGIFNKFRGNMRLEAFELLYVLTRAMLMTELSNQTLAVVLRILYNRESNYNVVYNYFIIKATIAALEQKLEENGSKVDGDKGGLMARLGDSYLCHLTTVKHSKASLPNELHYANPQYSDFCRELEKSNGTLSFPLVLKAVHCQLSFVEAVLNLLSLVRIVPTSDHNIRASMGDLTQSLCDPGKSLLLVQHVFIYIMRQGIPTEDFRNCIYALQDVIAYVNSVSLNELHTMLLYTICICTDNVQYLEAQLNVWLTLSSRDVNQILQFMKSSLVAVKATLYRLSARSGVNFAFSRLIMDIARGLPKQTCEKQYLKYPVPSITALEIHDLIGVYLKVVGMSWDGDMVLDDYNASAIIANVNIGSMTMDYDEIKEEFRSLGLLQRVSTVIKSFNDESKRLALAKNKLKYSCYNSNDSLELLEDTLSSMAYTCSMNIKDTFSGFGAHWIMLIMNSVLSGAFNYQSGSVHRFEDNLKKLQDIKNIALLLLPREIRKDAEDVLDVLILAYQEGHSRGNIEPRALAKSPLSVISVMLFASSYMKSLDFVGLAKLFGEAQKVELPDLSSFVTSQICNWERYHPAAFMECPDLSASRITLFEVLTGPDCNTDMKAKNDIFQGSEDVGVRACILKLLSKVNLAKLEVCQNDKMKISFDKLTHRFTGNTASGLLSRALGKAETGLSSITMKKMQFETLKGKFFTSSKKSSDTFNGCFLPILNFYNTAVLCISDYSFYEPEELVDASHSDEKEIMKWRSISRLDLLTLLELYPSLGVMRLLEMCNFTFNNAFVEQLHQVFHNFNVDQCLRVLEALSVPLKCLRWPQPLFVHLEAIRKFLNNFQSFPSDTNVYIGRFISSSKYRMSLFSEVAEYVSSHIKEFLHIYMCLDALFSCQEFGVESPRRARVQFNFEETIDALWTDAPIPEEHVEILDPLLMKEFICVLMNSFQKTFWESGLQEVMDKFKSVEPHFLQIQDQYRECLLALYAECKQKRIKKAYHWICWRKLVYRYLAIYPEEEARSFSMLFRPSSMDVIRMLEAINSSIEGFDITDVDNFEVFKKKLCPKLTVHNYLVVIEAVRHVDVVAAKMLLETVQTKMRDSTAPNSFHAARELYAFSVQSAKRW